MATFREVRDLLAFACFEDIIDEDEFLLLWELNTSKNLDFPYEDYGRFDLDEMDDSECVAEFRVKKHGRGCGRVSFTTAIPLFSRRGHNVWIFLLFSS